MNHFAFCPRGTIELAPDRAPKLAPENLLKFHYFLPITPYRGKIIII